MLISLRTLINTTLFRLIVLLGFWIYTKYDPTPAKYLLYAIGRDNLGNIEITTPVASSSVSTGTVEYLSNQLIAERLYNIEQLCGKSIRLPLYEQNTLINSSNQLMPELPSSTMISTGAQKTTTIPIIDNSNLLRNNSNL